MSTAARESSSGETRFFPVRSHHDKVQDVVAAIAVTNEVASSFAIAGSGRTGTGAHTNSLECDSTCFAGTSMVAGDPMDGSGIDEVDANDVDLTETVIGESLDLNNPVAPVGVCNVLKPRNGHEVTDHDPKVDPQGSGVPNAQGVLSHADGDDGHEGGAHETAAIDKFSGRGATVGGGTSVGVGLASRVGKLAKAGIYSLHFSGAGSDPGMAEAKVDVDPSIATTLQEGTSAQAQRNESRRLRLRAEWLQRRQDRLNRGGFKVGTGVAELEAQAGDSNGGGEEHSTKQGKGDNSTEHVKGNNSGDSTEERSTGEEGNFIEQVAPSTGRKGDGEDNSYTRRGDTCGTEASTCEAQYKSIFDVDYGEALVTDVHIAQGTYVGERGQDAHTEGSTGDGEAGGNELEELGEHTGAQVAKDTEYNGDSVTVAILGAGNELSKRAVRRQRQKQRRAESVGRRYKFGKVRGANSRFSRAGDSPGSVGRESNIAPEDNVAGESSFTSLAKVRANFQSPFGTLVNAESDKQDIGRPPGILQSIESRSIVYQSPFGSGSEWSHGTEDTKPKILFGTTPHKSNSIDVKFTHFICIAPAACEYELVSDDTVNCCDTGLQTDMCNSYQHASRGLVDADTHTIVSLERSKEFTNVMAKIELAAGRAERFQAEMLETRAFHDHLGYTINELGNTAEVGRAQQRYLKALWHEAATIRDSMCHIHESVLIMLANELAGGIPLPVGQDVDVTANVFAHARNKARSLGRIIGSGFEEPVSSAIARAALKVPSDISALPQQATNSSSSGQGDSRSSSSTIVVVHDSRIASSTPVRAVATAVHALPKPATVASCGQGQPSSSQASAFGMSKFQTHNTFYFAAGRHRGTATIVIRGG